MKTLILVSLSLIAAVLQGQTSGGHKKAGASNIPDPVKIVFLKENPDAEATWKKEDTNYRAQYIDRLNLAHIRVYDKAGNMVYREDVMESYPVAVHNFLTAKYPGEGFSLWSRIDNKGTLSYYTYRNSDTLWFDKDGKFVSPKKKLRLSDSINVIEPTTNN